jgi:hypothetical protein
MTNRIITAAVIAASCLAGTFVFAEEKGSTEAKHQHLKKSKTTKKEKVANASDGKHVVAPSKPVVEKAQESCITGDLGFDVVSNYITKGIIQENQGFIIQPYADLHFRLYKDAGLISSITADIGIWNSFHSHHPGNTSTTSNWYEFDFIAGLTFAADKFTISPYFKTYESPADVFATAYTTGVNLTYDDSSLLGDFALHPYALVELQLQGTTGNNFPASGAYHGRGQYYEVGLTPAHTWGNLTLSLPLKGGFGSGGFYLGNRGFGFFSVGVDAAYALTFIPECLGKWCVHAGATYVRLGGSDDPISPSGAAGQSYGHSGGPASDKNQVVFGGGLKVVF